jgi:hypothetical protein
MVMKRLWASLVVPAFILAGVAVTPALAQDKAKAAAKAEKGMAKITVLLDNDKVRVFEVLFKPGDENKSVPSTNNRVVRALKGGSLLRTYADGKTQKSDYKTGEVRFNQGEKAAFTAKNTGKSDVQLYVVVLK